MGRKVCGLCEYYMPDGYRTGDGTIFDCCTKGAKYCHLKGCYFQCNPKKISHRDDACADFKPVETIKIKED